MWPLKRNNSPNKMWCERKTTWFYWYNLDWMQQRCGSSCGLNGTGVAFAPTSCGVAFAPTSVGGRGECDPRVGANVTPAFLCGRRNSFRASKWSFPPHLKSWFVITSDGSYVSYSLLTTTSNYVLTILAPSYPNSQKKPIPWIHRTPDLSLWTHCFPNLFPCVWHVSHL